jgi:hypothetical protein
MLWWSRRSVGNDKIRIVQIISRDVHGHPMDIVALSRIFMGGKIWVLKKIIFSLEIWSLPAMMRVYNFSGLPSHETLGSLFNLEMSTFLSGVS